MTSPLTISDPLRLLSRTAVNRILGVSKDAECAASAEFARRVWERATKVKDGTRTTRLFLEEALRQIANEDSAKQCAAVPGVVSHPPILPARQAATDQGLMQVHSTVLVRQMREKRL